MSSVINLHHYLILNVALIIGYILTLSMLNLPLFKHKFLQVQRLALARYSLIITIAASYLGIVIAKLIPSATHSNFKLVPIAKIFSSELTNTKTLVDQQLMQMSASYSLPSIESILNLIVMAGITFYFCKYIVNVSKLIHIRNNSFCHHKINNMHILYNDDVAVPFCWSLLNKHYVVIPTSFLDKNRDLYLAIRHELQHIRQRDTYWLNFMALLYVVCFLNPIIKLWINLFDELQEFSCDESLMLRKKTSPSAYAQCLLEAATGLINGKALPQGALGINGFSNVILYRRVNMLFDYTPLKKKTGLSFLACVVTATLAVSTSIVFAAAPTFSKLSTQQVTNLIKQSNIHEEFAVTANPAVVDELNNIRSSEQARSSMQASLQRMQKHLPLVEAALSKRSMPKDLSVIPLVESGYQPLEESVNSMKAAGIWQIIPATGKRYGLVIAGNNDQRMNMQLATKAALQLLSDDHALYNNWKLAFIAYEIGEQATDKLIKETGSRDPWIFANSPKAPPELKKILARFDAALIIMHNPALVGAES